MLVGGKKLFGVPIFAEQDGICKVINGLGDDSPLKRTGPSTKTQPKHHQEDTNLNELGARLDCRSRVEVTLLEGRLDIDFGGQDRDVGKKLTGSKDPIDNLLDACTKHAGEELFRLDAAVDRSARGPLEALVMGLTVLGDDPAEFVDGISLLDVHWSDEDVRNFLGLREGKGKATAEVNVFQHEVQ